MIGYIICFITGVLTVIATIWFIEMSEPDRMVEGKTEEDQ